MSQNIICHLPRFDFNYKLQFVGMLFTMHTQKYYECKGTKSTQILRKHSYKESKGTKNTKALRTHWYLENIGTVM